MLRGPAHPENFRVKHGRYGHRWYQDSLPDDGTYGPMDEPVPAVSAVKNAWPKFLTSWAAGEVAKFAVDNINSWKDLERTAAVQLLSKAHERSRDASAARGTAIHEAIESLTLGDGLMTLDLPTAYEPVVKQLVHDLQPELLVAEAVVIKRDTEFDGGYGGTLDAIARLNGYGTLLVDWKSRNAGKGGTAYPDEFAQGAAYLGADYLIVAGDNTDAVRTPVPEVDGIAIVTIDPEGYTVCAPDELGKATNTWVQLLSLIHI